MEILIAFGKHNLTASFSRQLLNKTPLTFEIFGILRYQAFIIVTEAFMVIGCLTYFLAFGLSLLSYFKKIKNHKISGAVLCATAAIMVIGMSTYTSKTKTNDSVKYSWSYIIGWCSVVISGISATICFVMKVESQPA